MAREAAQTIGRLGPDGRPAATALVGALAGLEKKWDQYLFSSVCYSLGQTGFDVADLPEVLRILQLDEQRYECAEAFRHAPPEAMPELLKLAGSDRPVVARSATRALDVMRPGDVTLPASAKG